MKFLKYTGFFLLGAFVASVAWLCLAVFTDLFLDINLDSNKEEEDTEVTEENDEPKVKLEGKWYLQNINGSSNDDGVFIEFGEEHSASGFAGCNNFSTTYEHSHDDSSVEFLPPTTTLKICDKGSDTEAEFLRVLGDVENAGITEDVLILSSETEELVFNQNINVASGLVGKWGLTRWVKNGDEKLKVSDSTITVDFDADGNVSGKACNTFSGSYEVLEGFENLKVGELVSTKLACSTEELNTQETAFLGYLGDAERFDIEKIQTLKVFFAEDDYIELARAFN